MTVKRGTKGRARLRPERQREGKRARGSLQHPRDSAGPARAPSVPLYTSLTGTYSHLNLDPLQPVGKAQLIQRAVMGFALPTVV